MTQAILLLEGGGVDPPYHPPNDINPHIRWV